MINRGLIEVLKYILNVNKLKFIGINIYILGK